MNVPGLPASSTRVTDSLSPVTSLVTVTSTVPAPARSLSTTVISSVSPGTEVSVIVTLPSLPPPTVSVAVSVALPPVDVRPST